MAAHLIAQHSAPDEHAPASLGADHKTAVQRPPRATHSAWTCQVTLDAFQERMRLIAELRVPYICYVAGVSGGQAASGLMNGFDSQAGWLKLQGKDFKFYLPEHGIGSIWAVSRFLAHVTTVSLELFTRSGALIMRFSGMPTKLENAVWRDIIGTLLL